MKAITLTKAGNATLFLLHETNRYRKKNGKYSNCRAKYHFRLFTFHSMAIIFYGLMEIEKETTPGLILGVILGIGGIIPLKVQHYFKRPGHPVCPASMQSCV